MFFSFLSVDLQSGVTVSISICQNNLQYVHYLSLLMFEHGNCFHIHSLLLVMADICRDDITSSLMDQVSSGKSFRTAIENGKWGISCSKSKTSFSVSLSPMEPSFLTKWPYQKLKKSSTIRVRQNVTGKRIKHGPLWAETWYPTICTNTTIHNCHYRCMDRGSGL